MKTDNMNTKNKHYKNRLALEKRLEDNRLAQSALGYKELDKPIHHGYDIEYILRADIARRDDAWEYQLLIDDFGQKRWCKNKDFKEYSYHNKREVYIKPYIDKVNHRQFDCWRDWFQKFWMRSPKDDVNNWWGYHKLYICNIPEWYLDTKITKHYKTHYKVIDEVLLQEEAEIWDELCGPKYVHLWNGYSSKDWKTIYNKKDRRHNKQIVKKNMIDVIPAYDDPNNEYWWPSVRCWEDEMVEYKDSYRWW